MVHNSIASKSSRYIQSALKNDWKEGQEKHVSLTEHEPDALEAYINWLYTEEVTLKDAEEKCQHHETSSSQQTRESDCRFKHSLKLVKMYILGDYLNDMQFCNAVIDVLEYMKGCPPGIDAIIWVWAHTMRGCPLRTLILERWAASLDTGAATTVEFMKKHDLNVPKEFLFDFLALMGAQLSSVRARRPKAKKSLEQKCRFHKHVDDSDKCN